MPKHTHEDAISALILAGGKSSRMGTDKALLCWQGVPLLARVCQVALQCCPRVYVLTPWPDRYQHLLPGSCQTLVEETPGEGPLVALGQGLRHIQTPWVLLLACDLPLLNPRVLQRWFTVLEGCETMAAVPYQNGRWEALCGFYHRQGQPQLQSFLAQGGRSFQQWLPTLPTEKIAVDAEAASMLWNCNSPQDLISTEI
ncbi:MAG: molybdenum cofactor guanylyltransferase [Acaryochloris sp. SU_5_25]|nr:molybdenum cofactor guanylyltransferase [Acaryochloris sp. SU_5_25]